MFNFKRNYFVRATFWRHDFIFKFLFKMSNINKYKNKKMYIYGI